MQKNSLGNLSEIVICVHSALFHAFIKLVWGFVAISVHLRSSRKETFLVFGGSRDQAVICPGYSSL